MAIESPDARRWPEDHKRLALDVLDRNRSEKARVSGVTPVVAHHEDAALGYRYRPERAAIWERFVGVALVPALVVHVEPVVTDADIKARIKATSKMTTNSSKPRPF